MMQNIQASERVLIISGITSSNVFSWVSSVLFFGGIEANTEVEVKKTEKTGRRV
jgi:hypothetical protein